MPTMEECRELSNEIKSSTIDFHKQMKTLYTEIESIDKKLSVHIETFIEHEQEEIKRHSEILESQNINVIAINHLINQMQIQSEDTKDIIEIWKAAATIIKGVSWFRNILLWGSATIISIGSCYVMLVKLGLIK